MIPKRAAEPTNATGVYRPSTRGDSQIARPDSAPATELPTIPGYILDRELARGGMGRVYAARDPVLDRDVAIKTLLPGANAERFIVESKIAAQLQHPGIPPVHALGAMADGSPYLVMKLIRGQTLADLMKMPEWDRTSIGAIFESIAQAVAAAHERRIIHRDLKPGNVMVGAFGEVQVMDWGLAKRLGDADDFADAGSNGAESSGTRAGAALGTPGFMPPEQARGELASIDERSDVFGLGAILCAMLTGRPPNVGDSIRATLEHAAAGDLSDAERRLDACGADPEWIDLAKRCLRPDPADRPGNAGAVAQSVREIRTAADERARRAELERVRLESERRADERRRRIRLALAGSLAVLVAVIAGAAWIVQSQRDERRRQDERATTTVETTLDQMPGLFERSLWNDALRSLGDAEALLGPTVAPALRTRVEQARSEAKFLRELEEIRMLKATFKDFNFVSGDALARYESAFATTSAFGAAPLAIFAGDRTESAARLRASPIRDSVVAALDDWAFTVPDRAKASALFQFTADATGQDWRRAFPPVETDPAALKARLDAVPVEERTSAVIGQMGQMIERHGGNGAAEILAGMTRFPNDFWLHMSYSFTVRDTNEKVAAVRTALALRPDSFGVHIHLVSTLVDTRNASLERFRAALEMAERIHRIWPNVALSHNYLAAAHSRFKHHELAEFHYRKAIELERGSIASMHWNGLGLVLRDARKWEEALDAFLSGLAVAPASERHLHQNAGDALLVLGRFNEAIAQIRTAIRNGADDAGPFVGLGAAYSALGQSSEAEIQFRRAETRSGAASYYSYLSNAIAGRDPHSKVPPILLERAARSTPDTSLTIEQQLARLKALSKRDEYRALLNAAFAKETKNVKVAYEYGSLHFEERNFVEAEKGYRRFAELQPRVCAAHCNWGSTLVQLRRYDEAIKSYERAVEVDPKDAGARFWLANVYRLANRPTDALASVRESLKLNPDDPMALNLLKYLEGDPKMKPPGK